MNFKQKSVSGGSMMRNSIIKKDFDIFSNLSMIFPLKGRVSLSQEEAERSHGSFKKHKNMGSEKLTQFRNKNEDYSNDSNVNEIAKEVHSSICTTLGKKTSTSIQKDRVLKSVINLLVEEVYNISSDIDTIVSNHKSLTKPRKNQYGVEMTPLEQEMEDIKLGFKEVPKYNPKVHGNAIDFYLNEYGKFHEAQIITQKNLSHIDKKLVENIRSYFKNKVSQTTKKKNTRGYSKLAELLPSSVGKINQ